MALKPPLPVWGKRIAKYGKYVILGDVHLGFELEEGIGSTIFSKKLIRDIICLREFGDYLLILGDLKHQIMTFEALERKLVQSALNEMSENFSEVLLIKGNHDGGIENFVLPENFVVIEARGIRIGDVFFFHGHSWPSEDIFSASYLMMGHTHPVIIKEEGVKFRIQVWVTLKTNEKGEEKIGKKVAAVVPSFNPNLPGSDILREGLLDVLSKSSFFDSKLRAYTVDGIRVI